MELLPSTIHAWEAFARERGYRCSTPSGYPNDDLAVEASIDGVTIVLSTRRTKKGYIATSVRAVARYAMLGRVEIRSTHWSDALVGVVRGRRRIGETDLDARLSTFTSAAPLLRALLDPFTIETLRAFRDKERLALVYENGVIALRWFGVEASPQLLEASVRLAAYLALTGGQASPYR